MSEKANLRWFSSLKNGAELATIVNWVPVKTDANALLKLKLKIQKS